MFQKPIEALWKCFVWVPHSWRTKSLLPRVGVWTLISWETTFYWPGEGVRRQSWGIKSHWSGVGVRRLLHSH